MQSLERTKRVIIALHGWTGNINSLKPIAKLWKFPATEWVYIQGPYKENPEGYSWFGGNNRNGWKYEKSFQRLNDLIQDLLINGYKHKEMYILGFSQGACLAMEFMIRQRFSLGGIIPIAGFIKNKSNFKKDQNILSKNTRVFLLHGKEDDIIYPEESKIAYKLFVELGYRAELNIFPGIHKIPLSAKKLIQNILFEDK